MHRFLVGPRLWTLALFAVLSVRPPSAPGSGPPIDANVFCPNAGTLAYAEHMFVPAMIDAPADWISRSPVLTYNVLVLLGMMLTAGRSVCSPGRWTGDLAAGVVAGVLIAFNAHTPTRLPQRQAFHFELLPLALLAFDRLLSPGEG